MDFAETDCAHLNQVDDLREGTVVCLTCGLVLSNLFLDQISSPSQQQSLTEEVSLTEIQNLLDRIHIPTSYGHFIMNFLKKNFTIKSKQAIAFSVFKVLNDMDIPVSLKEISLTTDVYKKALNKAQKHDQFVNVDFGDIVEKYARFLNLPFKTISLIKEQIKEAPTTGHNPNSVLASILYKVCKKEGRKISIKKIADLTKVSSISIQRYNKLSR